MKFKTLIAALSLSVGMLMAQDYSVSYDLSLSSSNPEVKAQLGMLGNSTFKIISSGNKSRTEMDMGGGMIVTTTIIDADKNKGVMLTEGLMGKTATVMDRSADVANETFEFELIDETKTILGYECKKAVMYDEGDVEYVYWYTEKIVPKTGAISDYVKNGIPGLPLEFQIQQPQITMTFKATEFNEKLGKTKGLFDTSVPKGYKEVSIDDIRKLGM